MLVDLLFRILPFTFRFCSCLFACVIFGA